MKIFDSLLLLLKISLTASKKTPDEVKEEVREASADVSEAEWVKLAEVAKKNNVSSLLYDVIDMAQGIPESVRKDIEKNTRMICMISYKLLHYDILLDKVLKKAGIPFCIMKGVAAAADYPVPDYRKAGDIDILLTSTSDADLAISEIEKLGFVKKKEQHSLHHIEMVNSDGLDIEAHLMLAEPFDNNKINVFLEKLIPECGRQTIRKTIMGAELPVLSDAYHAFELLLHMLQHFLRAGFGVRLLCDWVVLWNRGLSEKDRNTYINLVNEAGIKGFSDIVTRTCIRYLGLEREKVLWMKPFDEEKSRQELEEEVELFKEEMMDSEEFGKSKGRMVALRGDGPFDYVREFHHQMHINFPKAGKCFLLWPVLWVITLIRFLRNNRKVRAVSSKELFASAKKRGRIVKRMNLFN